MVTCTQFLRSAVGQAISWKRDSESSMPAMTFSRIRLRL